MKIAALFVSLLLAFVAPATAAAPAKAVTPATAVTPAKAGAQSPAQLKSGAFEPPRMAPELSITGSDGKALELRSYRGKVVALSFGYTNCPEVCPTTLSRLAKVRKSLGDAGRDFQVVYVTVDPERDDAKRMREFLASFDLSFMGGTGSSAQLAQVYRDYGVTAIKHAGPTPGAYGIEHSSFVYLIDRAGRLRAMAPYGESPEDVAHDAALLLEQ